MAGGWLAIQGRQLCWAGCADSPLGLQHTQPSSCWLAVTLRAERRRDLRKRGPGWLGLGFDTCWRFGVIRKAGAMKRRARPFKRGNSPARTRPPYYPEGERIPDNQLVDIFRWPPEVPFGLRLTRSTLLVGSRGSGKTTLLKYVAAVDCENTIYVNLLDELGPLSSDGGGVRSGVVRQGVEDQRFLLSQTSCYRRCESA